jgi:hypothetical protein
MREEDEYHDEETRDLACADVQNALCWEVGRCCCLRKAEGHARPYSTSPLHGTFRIDAWSSRSHFCVFRCPVQETASR